MRPLLAVLIVPAVVIGAVWITLCRCAIADLVVRLSAWLYAADPAVRRQRKETWRRTIEDMAPSERPAQAGSLLWAAIRHARSRSNRHAPHVLCRYPVAVEAESGHELLLWIDTDSDGHIENMYSEEGVHLRWDDDTVVTVLHLPPAARVITREPVIVER
jgi:hypothetical protein